ncbi:ABC transporter ATP-binding protein [Mesorhizobium sp. AA22]|uniref:ABC transporter ATP-binding protein n=1 Tax=Mesorhizobium sp. AA22 TaxID=1854057 RepID=UPI0007ED3D84|nr:ABC transporter ATP-binding protein [Mesorhizobium sp. AA22]QIA22767.1 ABC transporter ATP-binding protein [Mesorhizobium sp. AA22]
MSAIHLQNLVKKFGDFTALKTMDLAIADGEFMALLGPSGCGKSTTMNMIAGMEEPTSGKILFGERDMTGVPMGRRGVGFVFQNYAIFTHMSVRQNLAYGPKMRGAPKAEIDRRVGAIAEMLQLTPLLDRKADRLSVNILQRVAIGRSAIMEPAIFREQVTLAESGRGLSMPVNFVERIGARTIIHLGDGEAAVKAVLDNDVGLSVGQTAVIAPAAQSVRVFDAATGLAMKAG